MKNKGYKTSFQQQMTENEAEKLRVQQKIAKARSRIFETSAGWERVKD